MPINWLLIILEMFLLKSPHLSINSIHGSAMTPTLPANRSLITFSLRIVQKCPFLGSLYCVRFHKAISIQVNNVLCTYSPHTFLPPLPHLSIPTSRHHGYAFMLLLYVNLFTVKWSSWPEGRDILVSLDSGLCRILSKDLFCLRPLGPKRFLGPNCSLLASSLLHTVS